MSTTYQSKCVIGITFDTQEELHAVLNKNNFIFDEYDDLISIGGGFCASIYHTDDVIYFGFEMGTKPLKTDEIEFYACTFKSRVESEQQTLLHHFVWRY